MNSPLPKKRMMLCTSMLCFLVLTTSFCSAGVNTQTSSLKDMQNNENSALQKNGYVSAGTEYWALIFAVGIYRDNPDADRPTMLEAADDLYEILVDDPNWSPGHIHKVTGSQATGKNLVSELIWLIQNADSDDLVVVYLTTHGSPLKNTQGLPVDLPPKDEADGADEILLMYDYFATGYSFIWDDFLNFFLSLIKADGVCLIVDSCYSGGYNDPPYTGPLSEYTAESFTKGFMEEMGTMGRVVLMSCQEDEVSYGSTFSEYLIDGFWGLADLFGNGDGINSAEEAFYYAEFWIDLFGEQHPTIYDPNPSVEFPITT